MHLRAAADCLCRAVLGHRRHGIQRRACEAGRAAGLAASVLVGKLHLRVDGYRRLAVSAELHSGGVLRHRSAGVGQRAGGVRPGAEEVSRRSAGEPGDFVHHDAAGRGHRHSAVHDYQLAAAADRRLALQQLSRNDFTGRRLGVLHLCPDRIYVSDTERAGGGGAD